VIKLPKTPAEVAALIGSNYASMLQSGEEPTADTKYVLSIHDLLSAFAELERESEDEAPGSTGEAAELKTAIAEQIKHEADKIMRELEQSWLSPFQINMLSSKVNGLMLAYEIAQTAQREPLTDAECDKVVAQAIDAEAKKWGIPADCLNADVQRNPDLGRAIVRAAHGITKGDK